MSSVEHRHYNPSDPRYVNPGWSPPPTQSEPRQQPHRVAYVFAVIMPILLVAVLAVPIGVLLAVRSGRPRSGSAPAAGAPANGEAGVGDPYFPDYGSSGYDALKYAISVNFDPATQTLSGTTKITARATQQLDTFYVDLVLATERVTVDGQPAAYQQEGLQDLRITPAGPIKAGATFEADVTYSGRPGAVAASRGHPWSVTNQEWTAAGEPESAAWWFPSDDHPSDPALMDVSVRVPAGMEAVSVGRLESRDTGNEAGFDTWHWVARQPMATYLNFLSIGQYDLKLGTVDGRQYVYAVSDQLSPADRAKAFAAMERSPQVIRRLETWFGPYPFTELGGIVPAHRLDFGGLECQTRVVYEPDAILDDKFATDLVAHELTHMWFGDNVTLRQWNDIFDNEGYASWGQWAYRASIGGEPLNDHFERRYAQLKGNAAFWRITMIDPGADHLFDAVYDRGPMLLQALKNRIGDKAFFRLAREWAQARGTRSLEEWMIKAQSTTTVDLVPFFQAWVFGDTPPAKSVENGFPS